YAKDSRSCGSAKTLVPANTRGSEGRASVGARERANASEGTRERGRTAPPTAPPGLSGHGPLAEPAVHPSGGLAADGADCVLFPGAHVREHGGEAAGEVQRRRRDRPVRADHQPVRAEEGQGEVGSGGEVTVAAGGEAGDLRDHVGAGGDLRQLRLPARHRLEVAERRFPRGVSTPGGAGWRWPHATNRAQSRRAWWR